MFFGTIRIYFLFIIFFSLSLYSTAERRGAVFVNRRIIAKIFLSRSAGYEYLEAETRAIF